MPIIKKIQVREPDGFYEVTLTESSRRKIVNDSDAYSSVVDAIASIQPELSATERNALAEEIAARLTNIGKLV